MSKKRCGWVNMGNPLYVKYHDEEWGKPVYDDRVLFEFLILEGAQAGLSWETILNKREGYRVAFDNFEVQKVAKYSAQKITELLANPEIVRNKLKIHAAINNAQVVLQIQAEFGSFSEYLWAFVNHTPIINKFADYRDAPAQTNISEQLSKDLKKRGASFVGPTIMYAFMQAVGMVNDHEVGCDFYTSDS